MISEHEIAHLAAENPEPVALLAVVADDSGSTHGAPISALNAALPILREEIINDPLAAKRVRIALYSVSRTTRLVDFAAPSDFHPPVLQAGGMTPLGATMLMAYNDIRDQCRTYKRNGIRVFRPWLLSIGDGDPTDDISAAAAAIGRADAQGELNSFAVGFNGVDLNLLAPFTSRFPPQLLDGVRFKELFQWVTLNLKNVSRSQSHDGGRPEERVPLTDIKGWVGGA